MNDPLSRCERSIGQLPFGWDVGDDLRRGRDDLWRHLLVLLLNASTCRRLVLEMRSRRSNRDDGPRNGRRRGRSLWSPLQDDLGRIRLHVRVCWLRIRGLEDGSWSRRRRNWACADFGRILRESGQRGRPVVVPEEESEDRVKSCQHLRWLKRQGCWTYRIC